MPTPPDLPQLPATTGGFVTAGAMKLALPMERWELARANVTRALQERVVVAFLGAASAGKDSAIRALFGVDFGQVDPLPGSTTELRAIPLDRDGQVIVVNAPGFGDLRESVEATARAAADQVDVAVFLVNADGGATADVRADLDGLRRRGRPVIVALNKMDLIRPRDRERYVLTTCAQLGLDRSDVVECAFDPLPALGLPPQGVGELSARLFRLLEERGKGLLLARQLRDRAAACESVLKSAARKAAVAGAMPMPGADLVVVTAIQVDMITRIAALHGQAITQDVALFIAGEALSGVGRGFVRWATQALKTAGWIPGGQLGELAATALGATIAGASTYGVGRAAVAWAQRGVAGQTPTGEELREVFEAGAAAWRARDGDRP